MACFCIDQLGGTSRFGWSVEPTATNTPSKEGGYPSIVLYTSLFIYLFIYLFTGSFICRIGYHAKAKT